MLGGQRTFNQPAVPISATSRALEEVPAPCACGTHTHRGLQEARQEEIHRALGIEVARDEDEEHEEPAQGEPAAKPVVPSHVIMMLHALVQRPVTLPCWVTLRRAGMSTESLHKVSLQRTPVYPDCACGVWNTSQTWAGLPSWFSVHLAQR